MAIVHVALGEFAADIPVSEAVSFPEFQALLALHFQDVSPPPYSVTAVTADGSFPVNCDADIATAQALGASFQLGSASKPLTAETLKVMSYNLRIFVKGEHWKRRCRLIADIVFPTQVNREQPDILGLQEVRFNPYRKNKVMEFVGRYVTGDAPAPAMEPNKHMLADLLPKIPAYQYYRWEPGMHYGDHQVEGLAVLSKFPIKSVTVEHLTPHPKDGNRRICVCALIEHPKADIQFFNTHVTYARDGQQVQCMEISRFMKREFMHLPQILMGDFNVHRNYRQADAFLSGETIDGENLPLSDTWKELHPAEAGYTFPSFKPHDRLDRILHSPDLVAQSCHITGHGEREDYWPSDHCALVAEFAFASSLG